MVGGRGPATVNGGDRGGREPGEQAVLMFSRHCDFVLREDMKNDSSPSDATASIRKIETRIVSIRIRYRKDIPR